MENSADLTAAPGGAAIKTERPLRSYFSGIAALWPPGIRQAEQISANIATVLQRRLDKHEGVGGIILPLLDEATAAAIGAASLLGYPHKDTRKRLCTLARTGLVDYLLERGKLQSLTLDCAFDMHGSGVRFTAGRSGLVMRTLNHASGDLVIRTDWSQAAAMGRFLALYCADPSRSSAELATGWQAGRLCLQIRQLPASEDYGLFVGVLHQSGDDSDKPAVAELCAWLSSEAATVLSRFLHRHLQAQ